MAPTGPAIAVISGPDAGVDRGTLARLCSRWAHELGVELRLCGPRSATEPGDALAAVGDALGAVVDPGVAPVGPIREAADRAGLTLAWVDLDAAEAPRPPHLDDPAVIGIRGRGILGYRWAILWLLQRVASPCAVISYGTSRDQVGDLRLPPGPSDPAPVAVLLHGGFWRERWERDTIEPLAIDLTRRGFATWNLEYRRVGPFGGGWPATFADVAAGIDHLRVLADDHPLDLSRVCYVGHSAGGQLALWAVRRTGLGAPGMVRPRLITSLAGIGDLVECARRALGDTGNAAEALMGGPWAKHAQDYLAASPQAALPLGVAQLVVQGERDNTLDLLDMNVSYARAAEHAGDEVELLVYPEADHFTLIDPGSGVWGEVAERISRGISSPV